MLHLRTPRRDLPIGYFLFDLDRTLTDERLRVVPSAMEAIDDVRRHGGKTILVTGRTRQEMLTRESLLGRFDGFVLESGGLVGSSAHELRPLSDDRDAILGVAEHLRAAGIDFERGDTCLSISITDAAALDAAPAGPWLRHVNRDRIDVTPAGIDKGTAARRLIGEDGGAASIAFADGENDLPLFAAADYRVAVANAVAQLRQLADETTSDYGGRGVARFLRERLTWESP